MRAQSFNDEERDRLETYRWGILTAIESRRAIRRLAENPLLCALLCALHRDRKGQLPDNRMELYEVALQLLLERRDAERGISAQTLSRTEQTLLLQDIAYWLVRNGWAEAETDRLVERLAVKLRSMAQVRATPAEVLRHLLERSGLLREPIPGRVNFIHRSFAEYLAARAAIEGDDIGVLIDNAHLDHWHEVVVLASGHASRRQREELLTGLLRRPTRRRQLRLLAVACLETAPELSEALRKEIDGSIRSLLPPRRPSAVRALAAAGEFVLDLLAQTQPKTEREVTATIQTASRIGGDAAMRLIAEFGGDRRDAVIRELIAAWPQFDVVEYADTVLRNSPLPDGELRIDHPGLIPGLDRLRGLCTLACRFTDGYRDFEFVRRLRDLETLLVFDCTLSDLSVLTHNQLRRVALIAARRAHLDPVDLAPFALMPTLQRIDVAMPTHGWAELAALPELSALQLTDIGDAGRLAELSALTDLEIVGLRDINDMTDLSPVEFFTGPLWFGVHNCAELVDVRGLSRWAGTIRHLWLCNCPAIDPAPLAGLTELQFLDLSGPGPLDLGIVSGLHTLRSLRLSRRDPLPDLAPLRRIRTLRQLWLYDVGDVDLAPLAGMEKLTIYATRRQEFTGADRLGAGSRVERR